jgi:hypothetical protein
MPDKSMEPDTRNADGSSNAVAIGVLLAALVAILLLLGPRMLNTGPEGTDSTTTQQSSTQSPDAGDTKAE